MVGHLAPPSGKTSLPLSVAWQRDCVGIFDGTTAAYTPPLVPAAPDPLNGTYALNLLRGAMSGPRAQHQTVDGRTC